MNVISVNPLRARTANVDCSFNTASPVISIIWSSASDLIQQVVFPRDSPPSDLPHSPKHRGTSIIYLKWRTSRGTSRHLAGSHLLSWQPDRPSWLQGIQWNPSHHCWWSMRSLQAIAYLKSADNVFGHFRWLVLMWSPFWGMAGVNSQLASSYWFYTNDTGYRYWFHRGDFISIE